MIETLSIRNFKSVKELNIDCSKVNVFIGEPNTGKSNILEGLGILSWMSNPERTPIRDYVRFKVMTNLFYDDLIENTVQVKINGNYGYIYSYQNNAYTFTPLNKEKIQYQFDINGNQKNHHTLMDPKHIKFYRFKNKIERNSDLAGHLLPSEGSNIFTLIFSNKELRSMVANIFENYGLRLVLKPQERVIEYQKIVNDIVISYPYELLSDTLKRIIFYNLAIESNKDSTLVFEEPEAHAFPFYTKYLGERIASDPTNQYFIATHNPYLLNPLIEKSQKGSVKVFVTYYEDYETKIKPLDKDAIAEISEFDPFLNIDRLIGR
jgi:AAA15 family ATPase/GTPase